MKKFLITLIISLVFCLNASQAAAPMNLNIKTMNGESFDLSKERGKLVVVTFWASWCNICRQELEDLNKLYNLQNTKQKRFEVIAINFNPQDNDIDAQKFLKILKPAFKNAYFRDAKSNNFPQVIGLPTTYIIDEKGVIREEFLIEDINTIEANLKKSLRL